MPTKVAFRGVHDAVTVPGAATEALAATAERHGLALVVETLDLRRVCEEAMALDVEGPYARPALLSI